MPTFKEQLVAYTAKKLLSTYEEKVAGLHPDSTAVEWEIMRRLHIQPRNELQVFALLHYNSNKASIEEYTRAISTLDNFALFHNYIFAVREQQFLDLVNGLDQLNVLRREVKIRLNGQLQTIETTSYVASHTDQTQEHAESLNDQDLVHTYRKLPHAKGSLVDQLIYEDEILKRMKKGKDSSEPMKKRNIWELQARLAYLAEEQVEAINELHNLLGGN